MADKCHAHTSAGNPCKNHPIHGATVCNKHGGRAPQVRAKATERVVEAQARRTLAALGIDPLTIEDVYRELLTTGAMAVAWRDTLAAKVDDLEQWRYKDDKGGEQLRSEIALYERAVSSTTAVLERIARLDLDAKLAAITTRQRDQLTAALTTALGATTITTEQRSAILSTLATELRTLT